MRGLWLISILLLSSFSDGRRGRPSRSLGRPSRQKRPIHTSLYSRIKKDLRGVEKRIQGELGQIQNTVTELKDMMEEVLIDPEEILIDPDEIKEVEPPAPESIDDNQAEHESEEKGKVKICKKYTSSTIPCQITEDNGPSILYYIILYFPKYSKIFGFCLHIL